MTVSTDTRSGQQYSLRQILGIWVAVSAPMAILAYLMAPALGPDQQSDPLGAGVARITAITVGLIWEFVLAMIIVRREEGDLRWVTIRRRLRLNTPRDPKTGEERRKLWLWLIPIAVLLFAIFSIGPILDRLWVSALPFLAAPPGTDFGQILSSPDMKARLVGDWGFLGLFLVMAVFNTVLGEEFVFRGVLLPKMEGVFGRWGWVANGALMGAYHWHQPWTIPGAIVANALCFSLPAGRFRSTWVSIILHSLQFLLVIPMILAVVLGLA